MSEPGGLTAHLVAVRDHCDRVQSLQAGSGDHGAVSLEIRALSERIGTTLENLAVFRVGDILGRHIPVAIDELDAIVSHTETATSAILDECEQLERAALPVACQKVVTAAAGRIYEACAFQDITGQRMAKVVQTLKLVESRVASILDTLGEPPAGSDVPHEPITLLNGPQQPADAMDQVAVDALLARFE